MLYTMRRSPDADEVGIAYCGRMPIASAAIDALVALLSVRSWWEALDLNAKLTSIASGSAFCGLAILAVFATSSIQEAAIQKHAAATARYMDSFVVQEVQELASSNKLSLEKQTALERLLAPAAMGRPIVSFRIWRGNTVAFSNRKELIGRSFGPEGARNEAWQGTVVGELNELDDDDDVHERALDQPLLEVYAPIYEIGTSRIIAVAETYELASPVQQHIRHAQLAIWLLVVAAGAALVYFVPTLVGRASQERVVLNATIGRLTEINAENESFRDRVKRINAQIFQMHERRLQSFGNELHDGPMQLVSLALLKVDYLHELVASLEPAQKDRAEEIEIIRDALTESLTKIRRLMTSTEPDDLEKLPLVEVIGMAARRHMHRTGAKLTFEANDLPTAVGMPLKTILYYLVSEGLELCHAPAKGRDQVVCVRYSSGAISVEMFGGADSRSCSGDHSLRMKVLRDRVEALGGHFKVDPSHDQGMTISANFSNAMTVS